MYVHLKPLHWLVCVAAMVCPPAHALTLTPVSDGSLYTCDGCNVVSDGAYVLVSGYIQGAVKFDASAMDAPVISATLTLNPYGLPLWGPTVDVYGYGTAIAALDVSDANAGTYLGTLVLPADLGYGKDAYFDVTAFAATTAAPYLAFNLRSEGTDVFSSLEYNYGHPSQLLITTVPEPASAALLLAGLLLLGSVAKRRSGSGA
jgi:hypothetical protein